MKISLILASLLVSSATSISLAADIGGDAIRAALAHPDRPVADREQDVDRKPLDVLQIVGVEPGMRIADLMAGSGWYSEIIARVVGTDGQVYVHNNVTSTGVFGTALVERFEEAGLDNVMLMVSELEAPSLPIGELDAVFMVRFYHDTFWMETNRAAMNASIFESLKPGGIFLVIDHSAEAGSEDRDTAADGLHRVDPELVKREILAAGFDLESTSTLLQNTNDDHTLNVFSPDINGHTDRFLFTFKKP